MSKQSKCFLILAVFLTTNNLLGQFPVVETPKPATPFTVPNYGNPTPQVRQPSMPGFPNSNPHNPNPMDMYERNRQEVQRRNAEILRSFHEQSMFPRSIQYEFPSQLGNQGTEYYQKALEELSKILRGETPLNLKDAVFTVENAFFENHLEYSKFNSAIKKLVETAQLKTIQDGYNWNNPITKNVMLFRTMADTLEIKAPQRETSVVSYPMQYDFEDYRGDENWTKTFVSKLLATNTGQCHSLPLLYLILCEETGAEASLAYSPSHSYIKLKDNSGDWHNLELTNGHIVSDAHIVGSGYVTAEAVKNGTYLKEQTKEQVVAQCISDLALGYIDKYGYDNFVTQCVDSVLKYDPNNLSALKINANHTTRRTLYVVDQLGRPRLAEIKANYPQAYALYEEMQKSYERVDATGHRDMPPEAYEAWLTSIGEEKARREHDEKYNRVLRLIR